MCIKFGRVRSKGRNFHFLTPPPFLVVFGVIFLNKSCLNHTPYNFAHYKICHRVKEPKIRKIPIIYLYLVIRRIYFIATCKWFSSLSFFFMSTEKSSMYFLKQCILKIVIYFREHFLINRSGHDFDLYKTNQN